jgi:undecaprenyl pyrophosphate synthase
MRGLPDHVDLDHKLIADVERFATGAHAHDCRTDVTVYQGAIQTFNRTHDEVWFEIFTARERKMRQFVARARMAEHAIDLLPARLLAVLN